MHVRRTINNRLFQSEFLHHSWLAKSARMAFLSASKKFFWQIVMPHKVSQSLVFAISSHNNESANFPCYFFGREKMCVCALICECSIGLQSLRLFAVRLSLSIEGLYRSTAAPRCSCSSSLYRSSLRRGFARQDRGRISPSHGKARILLAIGATVLPSAPGQAAHAPFDRPAAARLYQIGLNLLLLKS